MSRKLKIAAISGVVAIASVLGTGAIYTAVNANSNTDNNTSENSSVANNDSSKLVDENVYVFARTDGSVRKIVSSDWTKNLDVDEYTNFQTDDKKLPIEMRVTYKLDGESISAKDLAGKKGRVTMHYEFTNKEIVDNYYVPYAVISGLILDNEHFTNVEVKNAKLINDGTRTIVAGVMLPGMQENLGLSTSVFEIPSDFEVSADTTDFALGMTVSIATNEIFKDLDLSGTDSLDELTASLNKMSDAMSQLVGGSSDLAKGIETLYEKASALPAGVAALSDGASKIKDGSAELATGATKLNAGAEQLQDGVQQLHDSIDTGLVSKNTALQGGIQQMFAGLVTATGNTIKYNIAKATSISTAEALIPEDLTVANYDTKLTELANNPALVSMKPAIVTARNNLDALREGVVIGAIGYTDGVAIINEEIIKNTLLASISDPQNGLTAGTATLATGANTLAGGASELSGGLDTLNSSAPALVDGIEQLRDGSAKLSSGIKQFNAEGIQKLVSIYNNDIKGLIDKIQDIANVAKNNSKNVKYIYRTDEIKK